MPFDPLSWAIGFAATSITKSAASVIFSEDLPKRLRDAAKKWSSELPPNAFTPPEPLFQLTVNDGDAADAPALVSLQERLTSGRIPEAEIWLRALVEHRERRKRELGTSANAFFALAPNDALPHLTALAFALERACVADASLFRQTANVKLDAILRNTDELRDQFRLLVPYAALPNSFALAKPDAIASSLVVCESADWTTIGVVVSNSGLVVCASGSSPVYSVRSLTTRSELQISEYLASGPLIHAIRCVGDTRGVVPAYAAGLPFDDRTSPWRTFDLDGREQFMTQTVFSLDAHVDCFGAQFALSDLVAAKTPAILNRFTPAPVFNACHELVGISLTAWLTRVPHESRWSASEYVIQPWSAVTECIKIETG